MYINKIKLQNFRNYNEQEINLNKSINVFYGDNAQGKTNILEAIFLCTFGKSFRTNKEKELIKMMTRYGAVIEMAAKDHAPSYIANYVYDLVKLYNQFYHDYTILNEENQSIKEFRLALSKETATIIASGMSLLGIKVPERM